MGRPGNPELTWARQQCYEDADAWKEKPMRQKCLPFEESLKASNLTPRCHFSILFYRILARHLRRGPSPSLLLPEVLESLG